MEETKTGDTKTCPICGETIKAVAVKCRFCNSDLTAHAATAETEQESDLFVGHPAMIYTFVQWLWLPLIVAAAVGAGVAGLDVRLAIAGGILALGLVAAHYWRKSLGLTYRITTQRIKLERGVLWKVQENLELFRIDHFELHKPLGMRLVGQCALKLFTTDQELENFYLYGIPSLEQLADTLRECQLRERKRRGVAAWVKA
jgi:uncharacterized membrane protein YdbT with pleckstrin-like domain